MTQFVNPSNGARADAYQLALTLLYAASSDGWVTPSYEDGYFVDAFPDIAASNLNAFNVDHSTTSFDVTVDPGEAAVKGAALLIDEPTTVTLESQLTEQTVYIGWNQTQGDTVIIDTASGFTNDNLRLALWEFDTDDTGVIAARDLRPKPLGPHLDMPNRQYDANYNGSGVVREAEIAQEVMGDTGGALSSTTIDTNKDWGNYEITNIHSIQVNNESRFEDDLLCFGSQIYSAGNVRAYGGDLQAHNGGGLDVTGNATIEGNLYVGGAFSGYDPASDGAVVSDDTQEIFVQSTEPTYWSDGDIWIEP